jgi:hypothetical protein
VIPVTDVVNSSGSAGGLPSAANCCRVHHLTLAVRASPGVVDSSPTAAVLASPEDRRWQQRGDADSSSELLGVLRFTLGSPSMTPEAARARASSLRGSLWSRRPTAAQKGNSS